MQENKTVRILNAIKQILDKNNIKYQEDYRYLRQGMDTKSYDYVFTFALVDDNENPIGFIDYCTRNILEMYSDDLLTAKYLYHDYAQKLFKQMNAKVIFASEDMSIKDIKHNIIEGLKILKLIN